MWPSLVRRSTPSAPQDALAMGARLRAGLDALDVVNTMRDDGVLISIAGANEDTLKVRSPLVCQAEHVDLFLASFERTLSRVAV